MTRVREGRESIVLLLHTNVTGWGSSARQKLYFGPLGYESGSSPIQRFTSFERSYNYGLRFQRQFPTISLEQIQLMVDTCRLDTSVPVDMAALGGTKLAVYEQIAAMTGETVEAVISLQEQERNQLIQARTHFILSFIMSVYDFIN